MDGGGGGGGGGGNGSVGVRGMVAGGGGIADGGGGGGGSVGVVDVCLYLFHIALQCIDQGFVQSSALISCLVTHSMLVWIRLIKWL